MQPPRDRTSLAVALALVGVALAGCVGGGGGAADGGSGTGGAPIPSVTIPPERLTPFCQAMIDLADRLQTDPPDDVTGLIIATYERIAADVPIPIADDFTAVLAALQAGATVTTPSTGTAAPVTTPVSPDVTGGGSTPGGSVDDFFDEGYSPGDDPATRLNTFVDFTCRDSINNPGPPATQPLDDITPPTTTG
jgi:hypothetical protein